MILYYGKSSKETLSLVDNAWFPLIMENKIPRVFPVFSVLFEFSLCIFKLKMLLHQHQA